MNWQNLSSVKDHLLACSYGQSKQKKMAEEAESNIAIRFVDEND